MAYYVKTVQAGAVANDPRSWRYAVYRCDCCGKDMEVTVTSGFQPRPRTCSNCGAMGLDDKVQTLKAERIDLLKKIANMNAKLMDLETEISEFESKKSVQNQVEQITK